MAAVAMSVSVSLGVAAQGRKAAYAVVVRTNMVLALPHALRAQDVVQARAAVRPGVHPVLDGLEHGPVRLVVHVAQRGVVEDAQAVVQDLLDGDVNVLPGIEDAGHDVLEDRGGDLARGLVEDVGEVVLGEHRVRGVGAVRVRPGLVLVPPRGVDDAGRSGLQGLGRGIDDGTDEGGQEGEDEDRQCLRDLLDQRLQAGNLFDYRRYGPDDLVSEFEDRIDLGHGLLRVEVRQPWQALRRLTSAS